LFTINGNDLTFGQSGDTANPIEESLLKLLRVKASKDSAECVVRRDAAWQFKEGVEPILFGVAE
jgi:hypothetical protein